MLAECKICKECGEKKPLDEYYHTVRAQCKSCCRIKGKQQRDEKKRVKDLEITEAKLRIKDLETAMANSRIETVKKLYIKNTESSDDSSDNSSESADNTSDDTPVKVSLRDDLSEPSDNSSESADNASVKVSKSKTFSDKRVRKLEKKVAYLELTVETLVERLKQVEKYLNM